MDNVHCNTQIFFHFFLLTVVIPTQKPCYIYSIKDNELFRNTHKTRTDTHTYLHTCVDNTDRQYTHTQRSSIIANF